MKNMDLYKNTRGVIMMETILTLPIYIILLAGVFYLGELGISRLSLTHGERLRLWESGLRHTDNSVAVNDVFYFSFAGNPMFIQITGFSPVSDFSAENTSDGWGQTRTGKARANTQRSFWSWGANVSAENATSYGSSTTPPRNTLQMSSRDRNSIGNWSNVQLLSRASSERRKNNDDEFYEDNEWQDIYLERWDILNIAPQQEGELKSIPVYNSGTRYDKYVGWSN